MTTRTVTGTVLDADGSSASSIKFILLTDFLSSAGTLYVSGVYEIALGSDGTFTATLPVPDTGTATYDIVISGYDTTRVNLATGDAITLATLLNVAAASGEQDALQNLIDAEQTATITNKTDTYEIQSTDEVIRCDGTFTVTLPEATGSGRAYAIKNIGTGVITVACNGADTIDGDTTETLYAKDRIVILDSSDGIWDLF